MHTLYSSVDTEQLSKSPTLSSVVLKSLWELPPKKQMVSKKLWKYASQKANGAPKTKKLTCLI
jgi:hypothetical protein